MVSCLRCPVRIQRRKPRKPLRRSNEPLLPKREQAPRTPPKAFGAGALAQRLPTSRSVWSARSLLPLSVHGFKSAKFSLGEFSAAFSRVPRHGFAYKTRSTLLTCPLACFAYD